MENVNQLSLFAINYPFVAEIFNRKERNFMLCMLAQKYLHQDKFLILANRQLQLQCLHEHNQSN